MGYCVTSCHVVYSWRLQLQKERRYFPPMDVVNRHAPIRHKRVKYSKLPPWLNKNIIQAMSDRDRLKKESMFTEYKTARIKVKNIVRNANKLYLSKLVKNKKDISSVWRSLNTFTKETHSRQKEIPHHFTADAFNDYILSIAETLVKSQDSLASDKQYSCSNALLISVIKRLRELICLPYP